MFDHKLLIKYLIITLMITIILCADEETNSINKIVMRNPVSRKPFKSIEPITCFCNLPVCVTTTYMCKSEQGGCFSDSTEFTSNGHSPVYGARHGCVELLTDKKKKLACQRNKNIVEPFKMKDSHTKSAFLCCKKDMCNYSDNTDTNSIINETLLGGIMDDTPDNQSFDKIKYKQEVPGFTSSDVWFKAAIIAVPICGIVILLVLILLAVHILKTESSLENNYKFSSVYMPTTEEINNCDKMKEHMQLSQNLLPPSLRREHHDTSNNNKDEKNKAHEKLNLFQTSDSNTTTNRHSIDTNGTSYFDFNSYIEYRKTDLCKENLYPKLNLQRHGEDDKIYIKE